MLTLIPEILFSLEISLKKICHSLNRIKKIYKMIANNCVKYFTKKVIDSISEKEEFRLITLT